jgi:dTDP-glucose 4,6-dehydratase/UDP-glucose 4-epimerase
VIVSNFERIKQKLPARITGDGQQILDYLYIDDCVNALKVMGANNQSDTFNISSGTGKSILELTQTMLGVSKGSEYEFIEPDWTRGTVRIGSNEELKRKLGWIPKVSIHDGLSRTWKSLGA